ncbi:MAG: AraC family transcriptional regulator [Balneolaceae bacterium]|nr:MAG: AraC family transcriptional regulator [Balneolaceae bacterium]
MPEYDLHIKNMVCPRCEMAVRDLLISAGIEPIEVVIGRARLPQEPDAKTLGIVEKKLQAIGFDLATRRPQQLTEELRGLIITYLREVEDGADLPRISEYLTRNLPYTYPYLSGVFSEEAGLTIERYLIRLKIERAKALLTENDMTVSEAAWKLGYSSPQHLSGQFRKVTGMSVREYRREKG